MKLEHVQFLGAARKLGDEERLSEFMTRFSATDPAQVYEALLLLSHCSWRKRSKERLFFHYVPHLRGDGFAGAVLFFAKLLDAETLSNWLWTVTEDRPKDRYFAKFHIIVKLYPLHGKDNPAFQKWREWDEFEFLSSG